MRTILLDLKAAETIEEMQNILKETLGFPDYYGGNLDACYDMLTEITEDHYIEVSSPDKKELKRYFEKLCRVFVDAQEENPHLAVSVQTQK